MAVDKKGNEIKIIAWHLVAKNLVKFTDSDKSYKLTDKVLAANDFVKFPLSKGDKVEVGILDNTIAYLRKQKSEAPKNGSEEAYEPTPEEAVDTLLDKPTPAPTPKVEAPAPKAEPVAPPPVAESGVKELTVFAVAANKKVVKFLECKDAGWFQIDAAIQAQDYKVIGLEAKKKANVLITENVVMSFQKVASEAVEQPKTAPSSPVNTKVEPTAAPAAQAPAQAAKKEWKPASSYDTADRQKSIEAQAAVNSANEVAGQVAAAITRALGVTKNAEGKDVTNAPTANTINNMIRAIAEANFALIQELKKK